MNTQTSTQTITFNNQSLITLKVNDIIYTAVKPICENIGLDWKAQHKKLLNLSDKFSCGHITTTGKDGKNYQMLCMPIKKLNGWLFSINPEKVRPDLKDKVIKYQEECFEALYNYWHFGKAERKTTVDQRTALRNAVNMLVSKKGIMYPEAYNIIHQRFNVEHIEELTLEQVTQAIEYIHKLCFGCDRATNTTMLSEKDAESLIWLWFALYQCLDLIHDMAPALRALQSPLGTKAISFSSCYKETLNHSHKVVNKLTQDLHTSDGMALPIFRDYRPRGIGAIAL